CSQSPVAGSSSSPRGRTKSFGAKRWRRPSRRRPPRSRPRGGTRRRGGRAPRRAAGSSARSSAGCPRCARACPRPRRAGARSRSGPPPGAAASARCARGQPDSPLRVRPQTWFHPAPKIVNACTLQAPAFDPPGPVESRMATTAVETGDKGLKRDAIGYLSNLVIGVASTAPAYSLAATLGFVVATDGIGAHAYKYLNRADPDAGTTFAWGTRALGPWVGWLNGWAIFVADVVVMASLAVIASTYTFLLFGWQSAADSTAAILIGSAIWIALMTWICWRGIELSARVQQFLLG